MVSTAATSLRDGLRAKIQEMEEVVAGISEGEAGRRPAEGAWCVKEVLSHLCGDEGVGFMASLKSFVEEEEPLIGIVAGLPYYTPKRQAMTAGELLSAMRTQYQEMAGFLAGLTDEQLARKARVPLFKDTPFGENATLAQFAGAIVNFHLADHVNQIRSARQQVGA